MKFLFNIVILFICSTACQNKEQKGDYTASITEDIVLKNSPHPPAKPTSKAFNRYWYNGTAEVSTYQLEQARYGELRKGNATLIFVSEPFNKEKQVKADFNRPENMAVLKLNTTKNFNTGVYPYAIMNSTFYPVANNQHAIKVTNSIQEWCGQVFMQLNNNNQFDIQSYSYFESEADQKFSLDNVVLENELFTQLRIDPKSLPIGAHSIIPDFTYLRLKHKEVKAYEANIRNTLENGINTYTITYPELDRTLSIHFTAEFPHTIESWNETYPDGYGNNAKKLTTTARLKQRKMIAYWTKNKVKDSILRTALELKQ
jgi:hypothetical protein